MRFRNRLQSCNRTLSAEKKLAKATWNGGRARRRSGRWLAGRIGGGGAARVPEELDDALKDGSRLSSGVICVAVVSRRARWVGLKARLLVHPKPASFFSDRPVCKQFSAVPVQEVHGGCGQHGGARNPQVHRQGRAH